MVQRTGLSAVRAGVLRRSDLRRQHWQGFLANGRLSRPARDACARHGGIPRQAVSARQESQVNRRFQLREKVMPTKLPRRTVVIVGGGLTAALVARQLTAKGTDVLLLERGY